MSVSKPPSTSRELAAYYRFLDAVITQANRQLQVYESRRYNALFRKDWSLEWNDRSSSGLPGVRPADAAGGI